MLEQSPDCDIVTMRYDIAVACEAVGASALKSAVVSVSIFSKLQFHLTFPNFLMFHYGTCLQTD